MIDKHADFHRLAAKRVEAIADAVRIFSNLSDPSYKWTLDEVEDYFNEIGAALSKARARWEETKRWRELGASSSSTAATTEATGSDLSTDGPTESGTGPIASTPSPSATTEPTTRRDRAATVIEIIRQAKAGETEGLAEMVAMQREVIEDLQSKVDALRKETTK